MLLGLGTSKIEAARRSVRKHDYGGRHAAQSIWSCVALFADLVTLSA